jgi:ADP-ribosyl-[dinitrogen reductase] hydrolase
VKKDMTRDRFRGCLLGLACGDAVGTTLEFKRPGTFTPITDMVGGGPFNLQAGQWTDDTSMALCLADSLTECGGLAPKDVMDRWCRWWKKGEWSPTGRCFDIGCTIAGALSRYLRTGNPFARLSDRMQAGNGCVMRLAPVPMFFAADYDKALQAADSCRLTHGAEEAVALTRQFASALVLALRGEDKQALLTECLDAGREPPQVRGDGVRQGLPRSGGVGLPQRAGLPGDDPPRRQSR